jgi:pilus assembly protein CpaE
LRDFLDRLRQPLAAGRRRAGALFTFISNRGGVGKSTLSVNTACELARRHPGEVLLVDASLQLGICSMMLGIQASASIVDAVRERDRLDESLLKRLCVAHSCGLHLLAAPPDAVSAAEVDDASMSRLLALARRAYSFVVVDTFPMLDSTVMAILDNADLACLVLQGAAPSVYGAARLIPILEGIGFPGDRIRLILNRNHAPYPGELGEKDIAGRLPRPVDYVTPYQKRLLMAMNNGEPHILRATRMFGFGKVVSRLVDELEVTQSNSPLTVEPQLLRKAAAV